MYYFLQTNIAMYFPVFLYFCILQFLSLALSDIRQIAICHLYLYVFVFCILYFVFVCICIWKRYHHRYQTDCNLSDSNGFPSLSISTTQLLLHIFKFTSFNLYLLVTISHIFKLTQFIFACNALFKTYSNQHHLMPL